jgi:hypothetical protein
MLNMSACAASNRNFSFSSLRSALDFFSIENFRSRGRNRANVLPSVLILLIDDSGQTVRYVAVSLIQRRQALIAHGIPLEIADALDRQVEERLKGGIESQVDLSTHRLFNVKPTTFLEFAQRNAEGFGAAAAAA